MNVHDTPLVTVRCPTSAATLNSFVSRFGLRARKRGDLFDILSGGRGSESELDRELAEMALAHMRAAERDGALPNWAVISAR